MRLAHPAGYKRPPRSKEWCERISQSKKSNYTGEGNPFFGKHHSEETKRMLSDIQTANPKFARPGPKHWNWQGGISDANSKVRATVRKELAEWRKAVYERDHYTCRACGVRGSRRHPLNAHHIKPFMAYPESRFELSNGITLCEACHKKPFPNLTLRKEFPR